MAKDSDLDFVKADFYRFQRGETGNMYLVYNHLSKNPEDYNKLFNPSETPEALLYIMNTWSGIYKRDFIEKYGIRHNETRERPSRTMDSGSRLLYTESVL